VGIEVPSFCYYPNLSLQGACRMCLVKVEKMPKLQTACTTVIGEGMIVTTDSDEIKQARKSMLELLLGNHPLDCPVCDAGGECELQDMTFSYGAAESKFMEPKNHREEQQWSPVVSSTGRAASCATAACACAARAWTSGRWACRTAASVPSSLPIKKIIWSAKSAACASTSARWAR
jgi:predicted molibdopterin-dependent oxidoreductase YjgC